MVIWLDWDVPTFSQRWAPSEERVVNIDVREPG